MTKYTCSIITGFSETLVVSILRGDAVTLLLCSDVSCVLTGEFC